MGLDELDIPPRSGQWVRFLATRSSDLNKGRRWHVARITQAYSELGRAEVDDGICVMPTTIDFGQMFPAQPPAWYKGKHVPWTCWQCLGTGIVEEVESCEDQAPAVWDEPCSECNGTGERLLPCECDLPAPPRNRHSPGDDPQCQVCRTNRVYVTVDVKKGRGSGALCYDCYNDWAKRKESFPSLYEIDWDAGAAWQRWGLTTATALFFTQSPAELTEGIWYHDIVADYLDGLESEGGQAGYYVKGHLQYFDALDDAERWTKIPRYEFFS